MAIFDYTCSKCGLIFEKLVKDLASSVPCNDCGSLETTRNVSAPKASGVVLKGEGFYKPSPSSW